MFAAAVAQQALGARVFAVLADETQKFAVGFITVAQGRPSQVRRHLRILDHL
jgi:negative regulator of sigma E activity